MQVGYKIMTLIGNRLHSMADRRLSIPLQLNYVLKHSGGIWLGTTIEYVQQYYGSDPEDPSEMNEGEFEARCTFQYNLKHILTGSPSHQGTNDPGTEFAVTQLKLLSVYNVTHKKLIF